MITPESEVRLSSLTRGIRVRRESLTDEAGESVTIDSAQHPLSDDVSPVTETWEAEDKLVTPAPKTLTALADQDSDLDVAAALRYEPWRLSHMMILVAIIAVAMWLVMTLQWLIIGCLVFMGFAMILGLGFILARLRSSRQDALLGILSIAAEKGMPMAAAVAAFADQFRGRARRRVKNVVACLDAGSLLPEALKETPRAVSRDAVLMAWMGQVTGRLSSALRLADAARSSQLSLWMAIASRLAYLLGMTVAMQAIVTYLLLWYIPRSRPSSTTLALASGCPSSRSTSSGWPGRSSSMHRFSSS